MPAVVRLALARLCPLVQTCRLLLPHFARSLAARNMSTGPVAAAIRAHTPPSSPSHGSPAAKKVKLDSDVQEEAALASSSVAAPTAAAGAGTPAVAKGKKAAPPRNAPPPGPRKVIKPAANGPRRVKRKPVDEVVLNEIKVRPLCSLLKAEDARMPPASSRLTACFLSSFARPAPLNLSRPST